jgi:ubiquinone/menaquinone biosynthesis C-methylase UbiE/uncharacterized protein YbaR (Trm112 family)
MKKTPRELMTYYKNGGNVSELIRREKGINYNTKEIIEVSYDLQTGSYIDTMSNPDMVRHKKEYTQEIARIILSLCNPASVLEAGVGEATTFSGVLETLSTETKSYGFDLSWSRLAYARKWLKKSGIFNTSLCTGDLHNIPFTDNAIDVVYTSHSIEPNGGNEEPIIKELFRVTRKFLILLEPAYEMANSEARMRMESHGYCKNLNNICKSLGYKVIEHGLFPFCANPLNPTGITIIKKEMQDQPQTDLFACPLTKTPLLKINEIYFSTEALVAYPVLDGIPCLRIENGIIASKYEEIINQPEI